MNTLEKIAGAATAYITKPKNIKTKTCLLLLCIYIYIPDQATYIGSVCMHPITK